jgi:inosose dehydratase
MSLRECRVAAQPINWINDDFRDLGAEITLEQCLREMKDAGYAGTELGHRFPSDKDELKALLFRHGLSLASAWHSTFLAESPYELELEKFVTHAEKLKHCGSDVVIVCECTHAIHGDGSKPLRFHSGRDLLSDGQWARVYDGLDKLSARAAQMGMKVAYHHHMGTVVQDREDVDRLMQGTKQLSLLLDTGHITFAGDDALLMAKAYAPRIAHVHTKNVRPAVVSRARAEGWSFERAVREGVYTVPGDGGIDYRPIIEVLAHAGYRGWLVVEAEQDPAKANPFLYAQQGRAYLKQVAGV